MSRGGEEATVDRVLESVRERLIEIERRYRAAGRSMADLGIAEVADRMTSAVPAPSPVDDAIGPFYRTEQVATLLGVTRQAVFDRLKKRSILGVRTRDGVWIFPVFQFEGRMVLPGLARVLRALSSPDVDPWASAAWLVSPRSDLDGVRPIDAIREGGDPDRVEALARDAVARWIG